MEKIYYLNGGEEFSQEVDATNTVSDGYHTFGELYDNFITLFLALCRVLQRERQGTRESIKSPIWRSKQHAEGNANMYDGWFVMGIGDKEGEQITYHIPMSRWDETNFAVTLDRAPLWDGHTSPMTLDRLKTL